MNLENESIKCKYCGSTHIRKYGTYNGVQQYFCDACKRKFKADDSLFHMKVPANYVTSAMTQYYTGMSIEDVCLYLKQEYDHLPSKATVYEWVQKFTNSAVERFRDVHPPKLGDVWIADETMLDTDLGKLWLWSVIDPKTKFLIASRVSSTRTTEDATALMEKAADVAWKQPKAIITDKLASYLDGIFTAYGIDSEHVQGGPFAKGEANTSIIERWHSTLKERTKVMKGFRDIDTLIGFIDGFLVHYNYFRPHESLKGQRPAEAAGVPYNIKNWNELCRVPVAKEAELDTHNIIVVKGARYTRPIKKTPWRERRRVEKYIQPKRKEPQSIKLVGVRRKRR